MHNKIILIVILILSSTFLHGQSGKVDSLVYSLQRASAKDSILTCTELMKELLDIDNKRALSYIEMAYAISERIGDSLLMSKSLVRTGMLYRRLEELDTAIRIYESVMPHLERKKIDDEMLIVNQSLGGIHLFMGNYDKALRYYDLVLKSSVVDQAPGIKRTIMFNTGLIYYKLYDPDRALEYNFKTLAILREHDPWREIPQMMINIGLCYLMKKNLPIAEHYLKLSEKECAGSCTDFIKMQTMFTQGMIWLEREDINRAESLFNDAYAMAKALNDGRFQLDIIERLCEIYNRQKRFTEAKRILAIADSIIPLVKYGLEKEIIYKQNIKLYSAINDYKRLSQYQQKFIELQDSSFGRTLATRLMKVEAEYQQREAASKMEAQAEVIALKDSLLKWHRIVIVLALLTMVLLVTLLVITIRGSRRRKHDNILLEEKVKERTQGFSAALSELEHTLTTRDEKARKVMTEAGNAMRAIEVLCCLGRDDSDNCARYLEDIKKLSLKVIQQVDGFQKDGLAYDKVEVVNSASSS